MHAYRWTNGPTDSVGTSTVGSVGPGFKLLSRQIVRNVNNCVGSQLDN